MATDADYTTSASNINEEESYDEFDSQVDYHNHSETKSITDDDADLRVGENTPDTILPDIAPYPDISMFCEKCACYVALYSVMDHRAYHHALESMKYSDDSKPEDVGSLAKRRHALLKDLTTASTPQYPVDPKEVQKLNDAYEFLKADIIDTCAQCRQIKEVVEVNHIRGIGLTCSTTCALSVGLCSAPNERWKSQMEDTRVFQDYFGNDVQKCFFAVYDGHNGCCTAEVAANELHHAMLCEMSKFDPRTKCTCTFNMADSYDISRYDIHAIHKHPSSAVSERTLMHAYSMNAIQQIIRTCQGNLKILDGEPEDETQEENLERPPKKKKTKDRDPFDEKMANAFVKAHRYCDAVLSLGKDEYSRVRWSGCSTVCCVLQDSDVTKSAPGLDSEATVVAGNGRTKQEKDEQNITKKNSKTSLTEEQKQEGEEKKVPKQTDSNCLLKEHGVIHLANAGNIRAVLLRGNKAYCLSRDHTANNLKERARVLREGGTISESERELEVNGVLGATRGLGNHGDPALKHVVISDPYTTSVKIDQYAQMLVLASHGVWEVFSPTEVASILLQMLPSNQWSPPSNISSSVGLLLRSKSNSPGSTSVSSTTRMSGSSEAIPRAPSRMARRMHSNDSIVGIPEGLKGMSAESVAVHSYHTRAGNRSDLNTNVGSRTSTISGNDVDIETSAELMTLCSRLHLGQYPPSKDEHLREFAKVLSERLVQAALMAGARENITALVVLLPGCGL